MSKKYEELKKDVQQLSGHLAEMSAMANEGLREQGKVVVDEVATRVREAADVTRQKSKEVDEFVHENPWAVVAAAAAASFILGHLFHRSKK